MKKQRVDVVKKRVPAYDSSESSSEASSESTIAISASYSQPHLPHTNEVQVVKIQPPPPQTPPAPAPPINEPALQFNADPKLEPEPEPEECNFQDSTLAPFVFRQHLTLVKKEEETLLKLQSDLERQRARCALGLNPSQCEGLLADHGSKTNLVTVATGHHIGPKELEASLKPEDLNLANRLTIQGLLAKPFVTGKGFLLCRNAVLPVLSYANDRYLLNTIVEDMDPSTALAVEIACELKDAEHIFQSLQKPFLNNMEPSSVMLLQNPTLSERTTSNGIVHCVQVDSINDVKFLSQSFHSLIPPKAETSNSPKTGEDEYLAKTTTSQFVSLNCEEKAAALEWKRWGNEYSIGRLHSQALFAYDVALRFDPQSVDLRASRCASLINLGLYGAALADADYITSHDPFNTAFILREVNCLWGLDRFEDAIEYLKTLLNALTTSPLVENMAVVETRKRSMFIQQIIVKTEKLIQQRELPEQFGNDKYFKAPTKLFSDEPEYYKPIDVVAQNSQNQKYIAIANQKVKAGKLLVITKAFSAMYLEEAGKLLTDPSDELINSVIQKLRLEKPTPDSLYKVNINRSDSVEPQPQSISPTLLDLPGASNSETREFCRKHFYCGGSKMSASGTSSPFLRLVGGVWTFPKNIRHMCVGGNAIWYTSGNLLFVRAVRDIEKFEEITMAHIEPTESYEIRTHILQAKGLACNCPLCQVESTESDQIKMKRIGLLNETRVLSSSSGNDWSKEFSNHEKWKLNYAIEDLLLLRSGYAKLNFPIVEPLYNYGVYLMNNNNFEEAIPAFEKAFFVVDNTIAVFLLINLSLRLAYCYMAKTKGKDKGRAKKWFAAARSYAMLAYGCMEPVKLAYKQEFDYLEKKGVV